MFRFLNSYKKTFLVCLTILSLSLAIGFAIFGFKAVGHSLGYFFGAGLGILSTALPFLLAWALINHYIRRE